VSAVKSEPDLVVCLRDPFMDRHPCSCCGGAPLTVVHVRFRTVDCISRIKKYFSCLLDLLLDFEHNDTFILAK